MKIKYHELTRQILDYGKIVQMDSAQIDIIICTWLEKKINDLWAMHKTHGVTREDFECCVGISDKVVDLAKRLKACSTPESKDYIAFAIEAIKWMEEQKE